MILLRSATWDDMQLLYEWRNAPSTRVMMLNEKFITEKEHARWFYRVMYDSTIRLYIAETDDGNAVGTGRIQYYPHSAAEISWTIDPDSRNCGFGTELVTALIEQALTPVIARVKPKNIASIKIALRTGMALNHIDKNGLLVFEGNYTTRRSPSAKNPDCRRPSG